MSSLASVHNSILSFTKSTYDNRQVQPLQMEELLNALLSSLEGLEKGETLTSVIARDFAVHVILQWFSKGEDLENLLEGNCKLLVLQVLNKFLKVFDSNNVICNDVVVLLHLKRSFSDRSKFKAILEEQENFSKHLALKKQFETMIQEPILVSFDQIIIECFKLN